MPKRVEYSKSEIRDKAGMELIRVLADGDTALETIYRVKHLCCGTIRTINHKALTKRINKNVIHCRKCGQKARLETLKGKGEAKPSQRQRRPQTNKVVIVEWPVPAALRRRRSRDTA